MKLRRGLPEDPLIKKAMKYKAQREKAERVAAAQLRLAEEEEALGQAKTAERDAQQKARAARKGRLLTEKELRGAQLQPYKEAAKEVGKGVVSVGRSLWHGIEALGESGRKYEQTHPKRSGGALDIDMDRIMGSGFGSSRATQGRLPERSRGPSKMIDLDKIFGDPKDIMR